MKTKETMNLYKFILVMLVAVLCFTLTSCSVIEKPIATIEPEPGTVMISLNFSRQSGSATNQFAVWIEDSQGVFVKTLFATRFTAAGGYMNRPDSLPTWVKAAGLSGKGIDATTLATPKTGAQAYIWDLTDENGVVVQSGTYKFYVEGTLRWKNCVLYTGEITIGGDSKTVTAKPAFSYVASVGQPALTDKSAETNMIDAVVAVYTP